MCDTTDTQGPKAVNEESNDTISENTYVIIKTKNASQLVRVDFKRKVHIRKMKLSLKDCEGCLYNSIFELKKNKLEYIGRQNAQVIDQEISEELSSASDNRNLQEDQTSQKLSRDEIEKLKAIGKTGKEIVENLVLNSKTFEEKTKFSQDKYRKKKEKKFCHYVHILKPNPRLLCELFFSQGPLKILNLRVDSLAMMMSRCNIRSGGKYLVLETIQGLLVASVLDRLGDEGTLVQLYPTKGPTSSYRNSVEALNIPSERLDGLLYGLPLQQCLHALDPENGATAPEEMEEEDTTITHQNKKAKTSLNDKPYENNAEPEFNRDPASELKFKNKALKKAERLAEKKIAVEKLKQKDFNGLLIACKSNPSSIILPLLEFLAPSEPFAIFSPYQQVLIDCYQVLKQSEKALKLSLTENWLRKYQVLADRSHPENNMSGTGGYLLTGIKVEARRSSLLEFPKVNKDV